MRGVSQPAEKVPEEPGPEVRDWQGSVPLNQQRDGSAVVIPVRWVSLAWLGFEGVPKFLGQVNQRGGVFGLGGGGYRVAGGRRPIRANEIGVLLAAGIGAEWSGKVESFSAKFDETEIFGPIMAVLWGFHGCPLMNRLPTVEIPVTDFSENHENSRKIDTFGQFSATPF